MVQVIAKGPIMTKYSKGSSANQVALSNRSLPISLDLAFIINSLNDRSEKRAVDRESITAFLDGEEENR